MPDAAAGLRHTEHVMGTVFSFDIRDRPTTRIRRALDEAAEVSCDGSDRFLRVVVPQGDVSPGAPYLGRRRPGCRCRMGRG
ncbi:hypothetical protein ACLVWQ_02885 [Streptomyces sp. CWNU-52B]|uniref:hypothetical protein n=1 Tax=unclassified Streptomyces TaxID=2593676 RepID=UPI0039BEF9C7